MNPNFHILALLICSIGLTVDSRAADDTPPNILWIVGEDASPHLSCYGEKNISTPHLDRLASEGILFENAFVTCPVCSPSRSAMVTGMYQTTLGAHNHRSQGKSGKGGGYPPYFDSYQLPVKSIPELFRDAGYYVTNGSGPASKKAGKTDYNFTTKDSLYDGADWRQARKKENHSSPKSNFEAVSSAKNNPESIPEKSVYRHIILITLPFVMTGRST